MIKHCHFTSFPGVETLWKYPTFHRNPSQTVHSHKLPRQATRWSFGILSSVSAIVELTSWRYHYYFYKYYFQIYIYIWALILIYLKFQWWQHKITVKFFQYCFDGIPPQSKTHKIFKKCNYCSSKTVKFFISWYSLSRLPYIVIFCIKSFYIMIICINSFWLKSQQQASDFLVFSMSLW